jgi:hypothetical protein
MTKRRRFLGTARLLLISAALLVPAATASAQEAPAKAEVKLSELRPVVERYVEQLSQAYKTHTGVGFSSEVKKQMVEDTIANMQARGFYTYVDP